MDPHVLARAHAIDRATKVIARLANHGEGCIAADEQGKAPCALICQCDSEATQIVDAILQPQPTTHIKP